MNTTKKFYVQPTIIVHEIQNHLMDNALSVPNPNQNGGNGEDSKSSIFFSSDDCFDICDELSNINF